MVTTSGLCSILFLSVLGYPVSPSDCIPHRKLKAPPHISANIYAVTYWQMPEIDSGRWNGVKAHK